MLIDVAAFTDGACKGNPGPGGWGALLRIAGEEFEFSGHEPETTNNRMEMMAAISALEALPEPCRVDLTTDSRYVIDGITKWVQGWQKANWPARIKNVDLWQRLITAAAPHRVKWIWVKGHAGHRDNERVDRLASLACKKRGA